MKNKKGFTLIELIVVIAVIGILVLLAIPKLLGYVESARITQIKNDIKVHENAIEIGEIENGNLMKEWNSITQNELNNFVSKKSLYDKKGLVKNELENDEYFEIPKSFSKNTKTNLKGTFYVSKNGYVYYQEQKRNDESNDGNNEVNAKGIVNVKMVKYTGNGIKEVDKVGLSVLKVEQKSPTNFVSSEQEKIMTTKGFTALNTKASVFKNNKGRTYIAFEALINAPYEIKNQTLVAPILTEEEYELYSNFESDYERINFENKIEDESASVFKSFGTTYMYSLGHFSGDDINVEVVVPVIES